MKLPTLPGYLIPAAIPYPGPSGIGRVQVGNDNYRILGQLAVGTHSRVFLARLDQALTMQVVIKVASDNGNYLRGEWERIQALRQAGGFLQFALPDPVKLQPLQPAGRLCAVYRWRSGFNVTFADLRSAFPRGIDPAASVWLWNRVLELLQALHDRGYQHANLKAENLLVHPRDHGVMLCGWSQAQAGRGDDQVVSGQRIAELLGPSAPAPLRRLAASAGSFASPWQLKQELGQIARSLFGPPRFVPFQMP